MRSDHQRILGRSSEPTDGLTAALAAGEDERLHWLRYFHRWPDDQQWQAAQNGESLADVNPYSSRLITDFYAYDSYVNVPASLVYEEVPTQRPSRTMGGRVGRVFQGSGGGYSKGDFRPGYRSGVGPDQFGQNSPGVARIGTGNNLVVTACTGSRFDFRGRS